METPLELPVLETVQKTSKGISNQNNKELRENFEIRVYNTEEVFDDLRNEWNSLVFKADSTLCMSLEWIESWWRYFGLNPNRYLYVITVRSADKLIALAPLYIGVSKIGSRIIHKRLLLIGSGGSANEQLGYKIDYGISDFLDICVHPEFKEEIGDVFMDIVSEFKKEIDTIKFLQLREDSFIKQVIYPRIKARGWNHELVHSETCPFIDLKGQDSMDEYIKGRKSNARRRLRQTMRAMDENNNFKVVDANTPERLTCATNDLIKMHQSRWNELGYPGVFDDERFTSFFKTLIETASKKGWLWFKEAIDHEGVAASRMLIHFNGRYYDYISGLNTSSESTKYRPGFGLLLDVVREALLKKASTVELLRGEESYKYDFTSQSVKNWKLTVASEIEVKPIDKFFKKLLNTASLLYALFTKELKLIKIQYECSGVLKSIPGYVAFRINTIKKRYKAKQK